MKSEHQLDLPRRLQIEFSRVVQAQTDEQGGELTPAQIGEAFTKSYLDQTGPLELISVTNRSENDGSTQLEAVVRDQGKEVTISGDGNGPVSAFVDAIGDLGYRVRVLDYHEHALSQGGDALAAAYVECEVGEGESAQVVWGVGRDANIVSASLKAVAGAVNRA
jgi:2-isopropylmalate synthase